MFFNPFSSLTQILSNQGKIMATLADYTSKLDSIKSKVDAIEAAETADQAKIADLTKQLADAKTQVQAGDLSAADEATLLQKISDIEAQLPAAAAA